MLMHPAYRRGTKPVQFSWTLAQSLKDGVNDKYVDPAAVIDPAFRGHWLAGMASVEGTEFFVVSQRKYTAGTALKWWGVLFAAGLFVLVLLWRRSRRRARLPSE